MDLDDYYAEQEIRLNLPHETLEEYRQRLAVLKRQSVEQHVDLFAAVNAAAHLPSQEIFKTRNPLEHPDVSPQKITHALSESEFESGSKRQKLCDQEEKGGEYPAAMQENDAAAQSLHSSSSVCSASIQMNEIDPSFGGPKFPVISGFQRELERNPPHLSFAASSDDMQYPTKLELRTPPCQRSESRNLSHIEQGSIYAADLAGRAPEDGVQDEIDSFTEHSIMPLGSDDNHVAKNHSGPLQASPENSSIDSFSMGQRRKQRVQEVLPARRQRLELHPVSDVAQLGKKPEHASGPPTSPIEEISFVHAKSSRHVVSANLVSINSKTRTAKHAIKHTERPLKRLAVDQAAGEVPLAPGHSLICSTSSPQSQINDPVDTTSSKTSKREEDNAKKTKIDKPKVKGKKAKPQLVTPVEYVRMLQEKAAAACVNSNDEGRSLGQKQRKYPASRFLEGKNIFYTGGDMKYASATTRGRMDIIVRVGGNLMAEFDPQVATHIITDTSALPTLRALGVKKLKDIPDHIPTAEIENKLGDSWLHAAFSERMDAGYQPQKTVSLASLRGKSRLKILDKTHTHSDSTSASGKAPQICPPERLPHAQSEQDAGPSVVLGDTSRNLTTTSEDDTFLTFYRAAQLEQLRDDGWSSFDDPEDSDPQEIHVEPIKLLAKGWTCDSKEPRMEGGCPNQDIIDKLTELMQLHQAKVGSEDHWRAFTYNKCIRALRRYPKRIESFEEAKKIRGIGERTAQKIEEILQTGDLRRIKYEKTEDVVVSRVFQGIYGVGQSTAMQWWAAGCRTLEDLRQGKGGVKLNVVQEIGLRYYDDINNRMPREEAGAIFDVIRKIALEIDSKLFVEIMGSYRRGKATCGDIDILITRPTDDGKTHSGILSRLLEALRVARIITEDLALPDDPRDLEAIYRGLCMQPGVENARRRRIDFLCVPWKSRGAALIYYTGDDIFNRAMRLKANVMGYSLNQRGLFGNVVRDPRDRRVKLNDGVLIASETEEEIFKILNVPWQEPHERVRG